MNLATPAQGNESAQSFSPVITPRGHLLLQRGDDSPPLAPGIALQLERAFARGTGHGLLHLGAVLVGAALPPAFGYWRDFAARYVTAVCAVADPADQGTAIGVLPLPPEVLDSLAAAIPPMTGAEYATGGVLGSLWGEIESALRAEWSASKVSIQDFLRSKNPAWNLVSSPQSQSPVS